MAFDPGNLGMKDEICGENDNIYIYIFGAASPYYPPTHFGLFLLPFPTGSILPQACFLASAKISSVAFWLNIIVGRTGNAPGTTGKELASTTRRPSTPLTRNLESRTASLSLSAPMAQLEEA